MAAERRNFEIVEDTQDIDGPVPSNVTLHPKIGERFAIDALAVAIGAISKRAVVALSELFTLATVFSAFWLWWSIPDPNPHQIVALSIYAVFVLTANYINWQMRRR